MAPMAATAASSDANANAVKADAPCQLCGQQMWTDDIDKAMFLFVTVLITVLSHLQAKLISDVIVKYVADSLRYSCNMFFALPGLSGPDSCSKGPARPLRWGGVPGTLLRFNCYILRFWNFKI